ncbi:Fatty acid-binding protein [bioreactor metagenome]|uniref:Fatty acid-binding protein n=1 Tax=bioreactor metagenome TaxID=1076179 RepID=A0A644WQV8_9ZZZZ
MRIKITSDSTCDLTKELLCRYDITTIPLYVLRDGVSYQDGVSITPPDIYRHVEQGGKLCSTAAVNVYDYEKYFLEFSKRYDAVIHVNIGSGFSGSHQNACIAAQEFANVHVIDSKNLSSGQGHLVIEAAQLADAGADADTICEKIGKLAERAETSFLLSQLDYIHNGGRCSLIAALGANILHLAPCIDVKDGKMLVTKKYRGLFARCVEAYVKERLADRDDIVRDRIFITHSGVPASVLEAARSAVREYGGFREVTETKAGCVISCHCGPGTLGILFLRK